MDVDLTVAMVQVAPSASVEDNLAKLQTLVSGLAVDLVVLPETCLYAGLQENISRIARKEADWLADLGRIARSANAVLVFGGIPVRAESGLFNSSFVVSAEGKLLARYDKIHLFQIFGDVTTMDETRVYTPGDWQPVLFELKGWRIGLSICYDLRFPELYREYAGCDAMICTAAFTRHTGRAHWELLCRARAVENQCWFVAVGTCGKNEATGHESWGHSLIVDAWGRVAARCGDKPEDVTYALVKTNTMAVREKLPALKSRRNPDAEPKSLNS